jgi:hypothetical protein
MIQSNPHGWLLQCGHPWLWIQNPTQSWLTLNMCVAVKWYAFVLANSGNTTTDWVFSLYPDANKTSIVLEQLCLPARMCIILLYPCLWRTMPQYDVPTMDFNLPNSTFPAMWSWSLCEWHVLDPDINNHSIWLLQNAYHCSLGSPTMISKNDEENVLDHLGNMTKLAQQPWILHKRAYSRWWLNGCVPLYFIYGVPAYWHIVWRGRPEESILYHWSFAYDVESNHAMIGLPHPECSTSGQFCASIGASKAHTTSEVLFPDILYLLGWTAPWLGNLTWMSKWLAVLKQPTLLFQWWCMKHWPPWRPPERTRINATM